MKSVYGAVLAALSIGCAETDVGSPIDDDEGGSVVGHTVKQEVAANPQADTALRLVSRLYVDEHSAVEWYQPLPGYVVVSTIQNARRERVIDINSLRALRPSEVFSKLAPEIAVPDRLMRLEASPEDLQELVASSVAEVQVASGDAGLLRPQASFREVRTNHGAPYGCTWTTFDSMFCH